MIGYPQIFQPINIKVDMINVFTKETNCYVHSVTIGMDLEMSHRSFLAILNSTANYLYSDAQENVIESTAYINGVDHTETILGSKTDFICNIQRHFYNPFQLHSI